MQITGTFSSINWTTSSFCYTHCLFTSTEFWSDVIDMVTFDVRWLHTYHFITMILARTIGRAVWWYHGLSHDVACRAGWYPQTDPCYHPPTQSVLSTAEPGQLPGLWGGLNRTAGCLTQVLVRTLSSEALLHNSETGYVSQLQSFSISRQDLNPSLKHASKQQNIVLACDEEL
jgi:hypothetical protein